MSSGYKRLTRDQMAARLARDIPDFGAFETHDAYVARLKDEHGRKFGFWSLTAA